MTAGQRHLIQILQSRQAQLGMLQAEFAQEIGICQGHWSHVQSEDRNIGHRMAQKIIARFPDLWREVQDAMFPREDAS